MSAGASPVATIVCGVLEGQEAYAEVIEVGLALAAEAAHRAHVIVQPPSVADVDDEPPGGLGHAVVESRLGHRRDSTK